jgi:hypothetical protein
MDKMIAKLSLKEAVYKSSENSEKIISLASLRKVKIR